MIFVFFILIGYLSFHHKMVLNKHACVTFFLPHFVDSMSSSEFIEMPSFKPLIVILHKAKFDDWSVFSYQYYFFF